MITMSHTIAQAQASIRQLTTALGPATETGVEDGLDVVIDRLRGVTPRVSGEMEGDYTIGTGTDTWELLNTAASPRGYPYPKRVVFQPGFSKAYAALQNVLDHADDDLEAAMDASITAAIAVTR